MRKFLFSVLFILLICGGVMLAIRYANDISDVRSEVQVVHDSANSRELATEAVPYSDNSFPPVANRLPENSINKAPQFNTITNATFRQESNFQPPTRFASAGVMANSGFTPPKVATPNRPAFLPGTQSAKASFEPALQTQSTPLGSLKPSADWQTSSGTKIATPTSSAWNQNALVTPRKTSTNPILPQPSATRKLSNGLASFSPKQSPTRVQASQRAIPPIRASAGAVSLKRASSPMPPIASNVQKLIRAQYELPKTAAATLEKLFASDGGEKVETNIIGEEDDELVRLQVTTDEQTQLAIANFLIRIYPRERIQEIETEISKKQTKKEKTKETQTVSLKLPGMT